MKYFEYIFVCTFCYICLCALYFYNIPHPVIIQTFGQMERILICIYVRMYVCIYVCMHNSINVFSFHKYLNLRLTKCPVNCKLWLIALIINPFLVKLFVTQLISEDVSWNACVRWKYCKNFNFERDSSLYGVWGSSRDESFDHGLLSCDTGLKGALYFVPKCWWDNLEHHSCWQCRNPRSVFATYYKTSGELWVWFTECVYLAQ